MPIEYSSIVVNGIRLSDNQAITLRLALEFLDKAIAQERIHVDQPRKERLSAYRVSVSQLRDILHTEE